MENPEAGKQYKYSSADTTYLRLSLLWFMVTEELQHIC